jgi:hypothetical protein
MHPLLRPLIFVAALAGAGAVGWLAFHAIAQNMTALRSWRRTEGWVRSWGDNSVRVFPSTDRDAMLQAESIVQWTKYATVEFPSKDEEAVFLAQKKEREVAATAEYEKAFPEVAITTKLGIPADNPVPLLIDPANPAHVKIAGLLQMWAFSASMLGWMLPLIAVGLLALRLGTGGEPVDPDHAPSHWMFTPAPVPLAGGVILRSPPSYWKIALCWSMLGVVLAVSPRIFGYDESLIITVSGTITGAAFAFSLWIMAWRDATLTLSANDHGVRLISITGWKDVPWESIRGLELQRTYETYYRGRGMWELPSPGSVLTSYVFTDSNGRTLLHFGLDLIPDEGRVKLFELCKAHTGATLRTVDKPIKL